MDFGRFLTAAAALAALAILTPAPAAWAQAAAPAEAGAAPDIDVIMRPVELTEKLAAEEAAMAEEMARINARLDEIGLEIKEAEPLFDAMIAAIKRQAALGDPQGEFVANIESYISETKLLIAIAEEEGDAEVKRLLEQELAAFEDARKKVIALHGDSFREIRDIESQRRRFVLRIRTRLVRQAREVVEQGVARLEAFNGRLKEIGGALPGGDQQVVAE